KVAAAGGIGLADLFANQLSGKGATPHAALAATAHAAPALAAPAHAASAHAASPHAAPALAAPAVAAPAITARPVAAPPELPPGAPRFALPVVGRPSSGYGDRVDPIRGGTVHHAGFDLAARTGTPVSAAAAGTVVHAGPAGTYGNLVTVRHADGFETRYAHLSAIDVAVGDPVGPGQEIGKVGSTGYSTGPHLHFEVRRGGKAIDPAPLLPLHRSASRTNR
ncbi:MAG: M23 family metallopeptidase, partial [Kofleriaceae bacterium]